MTFGEQIFDNDVDDMISEFVKAGNMEIDTAYVYNEGQSEKLIGKALKRLPELNVKIATKVNPRITGKLDKEAVYMQFNESLSRLEKEQVDILYLHFPDPNTPVESALEACADLYEKNKFLELGLSNFPAWLVADVYYKCKVNGWMLPTVYEGLYNPLSRKAEVELNRALDEFGLRFYAYNPLAGGMLTNKYSDMSVAPIAGRFTNRPNYQKRYWKQSYFDAVKLIKETCKKNDIDIVMATYQWLIHHSMLNETRGDGIIIGASRLEQLKHNMSALKQGRLSNEVVEAFNEAWELSKIDAPEYFRFYEGNK